MPLESVAVVGASLAGLRAVETFRREGFDGVIHLVGDEPHAPYDRPPLSKQILSGDWELDRIALSSVDKLEELDVELHLGGRATGLDPAGPRLEVDGGTSLDVDAVVVATGARCRTLGEPMAGVYTLRTLDDAVAIRDALNVGVERLVVIGAGFIGAEVAASARGLGVEVTMVEMAETPFERSLGAEMGQVLAAVHRDDHEVDLRLGVGWKRFIGTDAVTGVELSDGSTIDADLVVVGVGVQPNVEWLAGSGLDLDNGIGCNEYSMAAPHIAAAGDVARWPNQQFGGEIMRVEHWDNATTQGVYVAQRLLHGESVGPYAPTPWFWTDQYDRKIQLAGRTTGFDQLALVDGDTESRRFAAIYGRAGRITAVLGFNRPRHVMRYRQLIDDGASFDDALAAEF